VYSPGGYPRVYNLVYNPGFSHKPVVYTRVSLINLWYMPG